MKKFYIPFIFGFFLSTVDVVILGLLKMRHVGDIKGNWVFPLAFIVYGFQALVFYRSLNYSNLTKMNLLWDLTSDITVTLVGLYIFKEVLSVKEEFGLLFGFVAILLLSGAI